MKKTKKSILATNENLNGFRRSGDYMTYNKLDQLMEKARAATPGLWEKQDSQVLLDLCRRFLGLQVSIELAKEHLELEGREPGSAEEVLDRALEKYGVKEK